MAFTGGKQPRVVLVSRQTEYQELLARHGTREQARFFLETRDQAIEEVEERHRRFQGCLSTVLQAVPLEWRRSRVDRSELDRFLFAPDDIVVALGQDGLVANTAKYLRGQVVIGLNPEPERNPGLLVPHPPQATGDLLSQAAAGRGRVESRAMVEVRLDDGQTLLALNELYVGHKTHQSARYRIHWGGRQEFQSSSGLIISTGTGATGWASSVRRNRVCEVTMPAPTDPRLVFFVREAWASAASGTELTDGELGEGDVLRLVSQMNSDGVIFGDGIESDRVEFLWGRRAEVALSQTRLNLLRG